MEECPDGNGAGEIGIIGIRPEADGRASLRIARDRGNISFQKLRTKREAQGLSLQDISERTGMTSESICRLEKQAGINATLGTAKRYAQALGLQIQCTLSPTS